MANIIFTIAGDIVRKAQDLFDAYDVDSMDDAEARLSNKELQEIGDHLEAYVIERIGGLTDEYLMSLFHEENNWAEFLGADLSNLTHKAKVYFGRDNDMEDIVMAYFVDYIMFNYFGLV